MKNRKAAIGATMTWIVATIIILFVVMFFIYASYALAKQKNLLPDFGFWKQPISNINTKQTLLALLQTKINDKNVEDYILSGEYSVVEGNVNVILEILDAEDLEAEVYIGNKKVILNENELEVEE